MKKVNPKLSLLSKIQEVEKTWPRVPRARRELIKNYMAKMSPTNYQFLGFTIPVLRKSYRLIDFKKYSKTEQMKVMNNYWQSSDSFEQGCLCLYWLDDQESDFLFQHLKTWIQWSRRIDNWGHADYFSSVIARLHEENPSVINPILEEWSCADSPWLNRLSLVGRVCYARFRKKYPSFASMQSAILTHIHHKHYYVRKAIGWTVRETFLMYPEKTMKFILTHAHDFPPEAWYAVTEKLNEKQKQKVKKARQGDKKR